MTNGKLKLIKKQIDHGNKIFEVMLDIGWRPEIREPKVNWFGEKIKWFGASNNFIIVVQLAWVIYYLAKIAGSL